MPRSRSAWIACATGLGTVVGLLATAAQVVSQGWGVLAIQLVYNLLWSTVLGWSLGRGTCPIPKGSGRPPPRFHIRSLMMAVAAVGVLFGVGIEAGRLSEAARRYQQQAVTSATIAQSFRSGAYQNQIDETRLTREIALLRDLKIPDTLHPTQRDFLKTLDQTAAPDYRRQRYEIIADGLEYIRKFKRPSMEESLRKAEHFDILAAKYTRAARRPWRPVAPDPPDPR